MNKKKIFLLSALITLAIGLVAFYSAQSNIDNRMITYTVDLNEQKLRFYWKDDNGEILKSIGNLKQYVEDKDQVLRFAMNAGMYNKSHGPQGLFIQDNKTIKGLDLSDGTGNFYLKPNGVFYVSPENVPLICQSQDFSQQAIAQNATQSGPMLLIDGSIHTAFDKKSNNLNIRNGVGILPDNKVIFAMSKEPINFYDFALFFQDLGCKNALYLDGAVSRAYIVDKNWIQLDGDFGVMVGVTELEK